MCGGPSANNSGCYTSQSQTQRSKRTIYGFFTISRVHWVGLLVLLRLTHMTEFHHTLTGGERGWASLSQRFHSMAVSGSFQGKSRNCADVCGTDPELTHLFCFILQVVTYDREAHIHELREQGPSLDEMS